ncbi:hypothetical protein RJT34_12125 [Clitoria ternatea]|uniref:ABC transporter domain-containing protein n=1 Tax=Clitoria ternatea TaxID=43366 RepID=A0AAN9PKN2_CLITE
MLNNMRQVKVDTVGYHGVSGGERRRISIGVNIIHDPIMLFLHEPTSRIESTSAYMEGNDCNRNDGLVKGDEASEKE